MCTVKPNKTNKKANWLESYQQFNFHVFTYEGQSQQISCHFQPLYCSKYDPVCQ
jgi:hypothetical protein